MAPARRQLAGCSGRLLGGKNHVPHGRGALPGLEGFEEESQLYGIGVVEPVVLCQGRIPGAVNNGEKCFSHGEQWLFEPVRRWDQAARFFCTGGSKHLADSND